MAKNMILNLWGRLREPRTITALQTVLYLLVALAGVGILVSPPSSLTGTTGHTLNIIWGIFAVLGGLLGGLATPGGRWLLERPAIYLCGTAVLFYLVALSIIQATSPGNRLVQMAFIAMAGISLWMRFERIREFDYEPGK